MTRVPRARQSYPSVPDARPSGARTRPSPAVLASRILVVDDDPCIRTVLTQFLEGSGCQVRCAGDGEEAWDALCSESFDLLITDHDMPRLSGLELLRRVRAGPLKLPVIMISGAVPWTDPGLYRLLQPGTVIEKPFLLADLRAAVWDLIAPPGTTPGPRSVNPPESLTDLHQPAASGATRAVG